MTNTNINKRIDTGPAISIIVPIYNVEAYLSRCIDSILNQSFADFELILIDDGSSDNCGAITEAYAKKDPRIQVIHQKNLKVSAARNSGLDIASGEWIAFVDPDDWIHKDYLKSLIIGKLKETDLVLCGCRLTSNESENDKEHTIPNFTSVSVDAVNADQVAKTRVWGRLIRREFIGDLRFIPGTEPTEDSLFNVMLFTDDMNVCMTDAKLYYYYMHPDSAIHSQMGRNILNAVEPLLQELQKIEDQNKRRRIISRCYKYVFSARYGEMFSVDSAEVNKHCEELFKQLAVYLPELNNKERIVMTAMWKSPLLYRLWRIVNDTTLLQYEKNQKRLNREQKQKTTVIGDKHS